MTVDHDHDHDLERRLQRELDRAAPEVVPAAPSVTDMQAVVDRRRQRNRIVAGVGAFALLAGVVGGAVIASQPDDGPDVIATAPDDDDAEIEDSPTSVAEPDRDGSEPGTTTDGDGADADPDQPAEVAGPVISAPSLETTRTEVLQQNEGDITVETRESAVEFAGGSGVFLVPDGDGYRGVAGRFGGAAGVTAIGLRSDNGLDWEEVELTGVPAGATATALTTYDGTAVALFSLFDVDEQQNQTFVGTSDDLAQWTLAPALEGESPIATGLAAGPSGVIVVGVAPEPTVWVGPIGGPYGQVGSVEGADTLAGVVAIEGGFVAAGTTSQFGPTLFDSVDGQTWTASPMSLGADSNVVSLSVSDSTIMLFGDDGNTGWAAASSDGGQTWSRSELETGTVSSVRSTGSTIGFLGTSTPGSTSVTLTDGNSWSSTNLEVEAPERIELLVAASDRAVLLTTDGENLTWVVAER